MSKLGETEGGRQAILTAIVVGFRLLRPDLTVRQATAMVKWLVAYRPKIKPRTPERDPMAGRES